jgi:hypothetical protein
LCTCRSVTSSCQANFCVQGKQLDR